MTLLQGKMHSVFCLIDWNLDALVVSQIQCVCKSLFIELKFEGVFCELQKQNFRI